MRFLTYLSQGYLIEYTHKAWKSPYRHRFGGQNTIEGAVCPNCQRPLTLYFTVDTRDPRLNLSHLPVEELPLLYCLRCKISKDEALSYRILDTHKIEIVQYTISQSLRYEGYPESFPERVAHLIPLPGELQVIFKLINRGQLSPNDVEKHLPEWDTQVFPRHQIGGEPLIVMPLYSWSEGYGEKCPLCKEPAPFFVCIGNDYVDEFMEGGSRFYSVSGGLIGAYWCELLFHFCERCMVIISFVECD